MKSMITAAAQHKKSSSKQQGNVAVVLTVGLVYVAGVASMTQSSFALRQSALEERLAVPTTTNSNNSKPTMTRLLQEPLSKSAKIRLLTNSSNTDVLDTCEHTIVTGYFRMASKYPPNYYATWMTNFLSIQDCMVIFTSSDMVDTIIGLRSKHAATKTVVIDIGTIDNLPVSRMGSEFWQHQLDIDPEKRMHKSYQLFWIWLSKSWCVVQAIQHNFFRSKQLFMWQDIGSYRKDNYNGQKILVHPEVVPSRTILWLAHHNTIPPPNPIWNDKFKQKKHYFHSGSQGIGEAAVWLEYHDKFARTIEQFLDRDMFIGEDQCVLQSTCQQHPSMCAYIPAKEVKDNFYFGLRYALVNGGNFTRWRMPPLTENQPAV